MMRSWTLLVSIIAGSVQAAELGCDTAELWELRTFMDRSREQIASMRASSDRLSEQVKRLREQLARAEARNQSQARELDGLRARVDSRISSRGVDREVQAEFFAYLAMRLRGKRGLRVLKDRVIIPTDRLIQSNAALLTAEGEKWLTPALPAIASALQRLPKGPAWSLRIEGHTDNRPLISKQLASNWELSTLRAVAVLKFLIRGGIDSSKLQAVGLASTRPRDSGADRRALRRNRRIEIHLIALR